MTQSGITFAGALAPKNSNDVVVKARFVQIPGSLHIGLERFPVSNVVHRLSIRPLALLTLYMEIPRKLTQTPGSRQ
jgi:hypothetical protein